MNTPREILLNRHRPVTPRLDALRRAIVAEHVGAPADEAPVPLAARLWEELFWCCRRAWMGLAAAWALVLLLNLTGHMAPAVTVSGSTGTQLVNLRMALAERHRLRAELLDSAPPAAADRNDAAPASAPRSANDIHLGGASYDEPRSHSHLVGRTVPVSRFARFPPHTLAPAQREASYPTCV